MFNIVSLFTKSRPNFLAHRLGYLFFRHSRNVKKQNKQLWFSIDTINANRATLEVSFCLHLYMIFSCEIFVLLLVKFQLYIKWSPGNFLIWLQSCPVYFKHIKKVLSWLPWRKRSLLSMATMDGNGWRNVNPHLPLSST